jgi:hypothetical protein
MMLYGRTVHGIRCFMVCRGGSQCNKSMLRFDSLFLTNAFFIKEWAILGVYDGYMVI